MLEPNRQHGGQKQSETSAKPKGVNLSLEELKNVLKNTFSSTRTVQIAKFPIISHFFFSAVMLMPRHAKA